MNRFISIAIIIMAIFLLVGEDVSGIFHLLGLIFILYGMAHLLLHNRLPAGFIKYFALLIFGPLLITTLIRAMLDIFHKDEISQQWLSVLLIIGVLLLCVGWYLRSRRQIRERKGADQFQLRGSEREFIMPFEQDRTRAKEISDEEDQ